MTALRLIWAIFTWIAYQILCLPLMVAGLFVVPVAIRYRVWLTSAITGKLIVTAPRWLWLWGNDEDGYAPEWYMAAYPDRSTWWRMYVWAALRNSVNNLRFVRWLHPPPDPTRIRFVMGARWTLVWQGPFYRLDLNGRNWRFGIGWRYAVSDAKGVAPDDWRRFGVGFGLRFKWES